MTPNIKDLLQPIEREFKVVDKHPYRLSRNQLKSKRKLTRKGR